MHHAHDAGGSSVQLDIQDLHGNGIFVKPFAIDIGQVGVHRLSLPCTEVLHFLGKPGDIGFNSFVVAHLALDVVGDEGSYFVLGQRRTASGTPPKHSARGADDHHVFHS